MTVPIEPYSGRPLSSGCELSGGSAEDPLPEMPVLVLSDLGLLLFSDELPDISSKSFVRVMPLLSQPVSESAIAAAKGAVINLFIFSPI